jgi:hypothetical protein
MPFGSRALTTETMTHAMHRAPDRERKLERLAEKLFFELKRQGQRYSLSRKLGEFAPQSNLTLDEVEELLERWKLRGPHGG